MQISQPLCPGRGVGIDASMVLETLARIKYERASERGERHWTLMSGFDA